MPQKSHRGNVMHEAFGKCGLVVVAGGKGTRFGGPKQLAHLAGRPLLLHTLEAFASLPFAARVVVLPAEYLTDGTWEALRGASPAAATFRAVPGGAERDRSVAAGLAALPPDVPFAAVQDGARPFPPLEALPAALERLSVDPDLAAVVLSAPVVDTIKRVSQPENRVLATEDRSALRRAETPQFVRRALLLAALNDPRSHGSRDDAEALERLGHRTACHVHTGFNPKVTAPADLAVAEAWLQQRRAGFGTLCPFATGIGYDVHPFAEGRRLVLGGVEIPHDRGLAGHSDADVLLHALCDALLGAAGLPDIGHFFPNTDIRWKGADSRVLLREVCARIEELGWRPGNVDVAVVAERPKLAPHLALMKDRIGADLGLPPARVGIKATTNEKLGFLGRGEGIAAMATAFLWRLER